MIKEEYMGEPQNKKKKYIGSKVDDSLNSIARVCCLLAIAFSGFALGYVVGPDVSSSPPSNKIEAIVMKGEPGAWEKFTSDGVVYYRQIENDNVRWRSEDGVLLSWYKSPRHILSTEEVGISLERKRSETLRAIETARIKSKLPK